MQADSEKTKRRYNRIAPFFDGIEVLLEGLFFSRWRQTLWQKVEGEHILEIGVGTGKNFQFYPELKQITALDFSDKMLEKARQKQLHLHKNLSVDLELMDIESLCYADNCFDTVIATFVFCSVPKPHKGLQEVFRVCKPGGQVLLLEHVISSKPILAKLMQIFNPVVAFLIGANINRDTVKAVQACGFAKVLVDTNSSDMLKLIQAIK